MKVGIALGGGGAKGFAHIGVLEVLTEAGIDCQVVTGTSAGALIGAAYCCNKLSEMKAKTKTISLKDIPSILSPAWSMQGFSNGKNALDFLSDFMTVDRIEDLPKSFGATAVDLLKGELVEFSSGDLREVLRSTISIPGLFTPIAIDGRLLVDGGVVEVLPIDLTRKLGADFVIAVDLYGSNAEAPVSLPARKPLWPKGLKSALSYISGNPRGEKAKQLNLIKIIEATIAAIQKSSTQLRLREHPADILIQPAVSKVGALDFHRAEPVIEIGRIAAQEILPLLREKLKEKSL
jgi:NTE family protein